MVKLLRLRPLSDPSSKRDHPQSESRLGTLGVFVLFPIYIGAWLVWFSAILTVPYHALGALGVFSVAPDAISLSEAAILLVVAQRAIVTIGFGTDEWLRMPPRWEAALILVGAAGLLVFRDT